MPTKDPIKKRAKHARWRAKHRQHIRDYSNNRWRTNEQVRLQRKAYTRRLRLETIAAYGGKCACCGETEPDFLTLDHIKGTKIPKRTKTVFRGGNHFYQWLKKNGYPPGLEVRCYNCNCSRGHYGTCPHEREPLAPERIGT